MENVTNLVNLQSIFSKTEFLSTEFFHGWLLSRDIFLIVSNVRLCIARESLHTFWMARFALALNEESSPCRIAVDSPFLASSHWVRQLWNCGNVHSRYLKRLTCSICAVWYHTEHLGVLLTLWRATHSLLLDSPTCSVLHNLSYDFQLQPVILVNLSLIASSSADMIARTFVFNVFFRIVSRWMKSIGDGEGVSLMETPSSDYITPMVPVIDFRFCFHQETPGFTRSFSGSNRHATYKQHG